MLTATQQDYMEAIYRLEKKLGTVRVTDIADKLGTRLPTVTRTVRKLTELGFLIHPVRGKVSLTRRGKLVAGQIVHLHDDLMYFFTEVLGVSATQARVDVAQIEHGFSEGSAERLHYFLEHYEQLDSGERKIVAGFKRRLRGESKQFSDISSEKGSGWRL